MSSWLALRHFFPPLEAGCDCVVEPRDIHPTDALQAQLEEWQQPQIEILQLPSYLPLLNLIEILWRFIKYESLQVRDYCS